MPEKALKTYEQALATAILNKHKASSITSHQNALAEFKTRLKLQARSNRLVVLVTLTLQLVTARQFYNHN